MTKGRSSNSTTSTNSNNTCSSGASSSSSDMQIELMTTLFSKIVEQMKRDQQQLIEVITDKFNQQLLDLHDENAKLKAKLAVIEERMVSTQLHLINKNSCSATDSVNTASPISLEKGSTSAWSNVARELAQNTTSISESPALKAKKKMLQGIGTNTTTYRIKPAPKKQPQQYPTKIFLTRIAAETEECEVKEHVKDVFCLDVDVKKLDTKHPSYSSFLISASSSNYKTLLDETKWPASSAIRRWYEPRTTPADNEDTVTDKSGEVDQSTKD